MSEKSKGDVSSSNAKIVKNPLLSASVTGLTFDDFPNKPLLLPAAPPIVRKVSQPEISLSGILNRETKSLVTVGHSSSIDTENLDEINLNLSAEDSPPSNTKSSNNDRDINLNTLEDHPNTVGTTDSILSQAASSFTALPAVASNVFSTFSKRIYASSSSASRECTPPLAVQHDANANAVPPQLDIQPSFIQTSAATQAPLPPPEAYSALSLQGSSSSPASSFVSADNVSLTAGTIAPPQQHQEPPKFYTPAEVPALPTLDSSNTLASNKQNTYRFASRKKIYAPIPGFSEQAQTQAQSQPAQLQLQPQPPTQQLPQTTPLLGAPTYTGAATFAASEAQPKPEERKIGGLFSITSNVLQNLTGLVQSAADNLSQSVRPISEPTQTPSSLNQYYPAAPEVINYFGEPTANSNTNFYNPTASVGVPTQTAQAPPPALSGFFAPKAEPTNFEAIYNPTVQAQELTVPTASSSEQVTLQNPPAISFYSPPTQVQELTAAPPPVSTQQTTVGAPTSQVLPPPSSAQASGPPVVGQVVAPPPSIGGQPPQSVKQTSFRLQKGTRLYKNPLNSEETTVPAPIAVAQPLGLAPVSAANNLFNPFLPPQSANSTVSAAAPLSQPILPPTQQYNQSPNIFNPSQISDSTVSVTASIVPQAEIPKPAPTIFNPAQISDSTATPENQPILPPTQQFNQAPSIFNPSQISDSTVSEAAPIEPQTEIPQAAPTIFNPIQISYATIPATAPSTEIPKQAPTIFNPFAATSPEDNSPIKLQTIEIPTQIDSVPQTQELSLDQQRLPQTETTPSDTFENQTHTKAAEEPTETVPTKVEVSAETTNWTTEQPTAPISSVIGFFVPSDTTSSGVPSATTTVSDTVPLISALPAPTEFETNTNTDSLDTALSAFNLSNTPAPASVTYQATTAQPSLANFFADTNNFAGEGFNFLTPTNTTTSVAPQADNFQASAPSAAFGNFFVKEPQPEISFPALPPQIGIAPPPLTIEAPQSETQATTSSATTTATTTGTSIGFDSFLNNEVTQSENSIDNQVHSGIQTTQFSEQNSTFNSSDNNSFSKYFSNQSENQIENQNFDISKSNSAPVPTKTESVQLPSNTDQSKLADSTFFDTFGTGTKPTPLPVSVPSAAPSTASIPVTEATIVVPEVGVSVLSTSAVNEDQRIQNFFNNPPSNENAGGVGDLNYDLVHSGLGVRYLQTRSQSPVSNLVEPPSSACSELSELTNVTQTQTQQQQQQQQQQHQQKLTGTPTDTTLQRSQYLIDSSKTSASNLLQQHYDDLPEEILNTLRMANAAPNETDTSAPSVPMVYTPAVRHWFYKRSSGTKHVWTPFSHYDSALLETSLGDEAANLVPVEGGRYDVNIKERTKTPVYWEGKAIEVRRCSWFYKGVDSKYIPYEEETAELLEAKYKRAAETGEWHQKIILGMGEQVVFHGPTVIVHFHQQQNVDAWGGTSQTSLRPRVVKRDLDDFTIEQGESQRVDHLLFMVHGIGSACDLKMRTVEEVVDDFRTIAQQLIQSHYKNSTEMGVVGRVEVLPISWHNHLHSEELGIDEKLKSITLESIPKLRNFTNDTLLDVLFYTSPTYCQRIMNTVAISLNEVYLKYRARHPDFNGGVSLAGHSLGSLIIFDLLCHQEPIKEFEEENKENPDQQTHPDTNEKSGTNDAECLARQVSYTMGPAGTGQPYINYTQLIFQPKKFFALGSPIGMFVTIRGIDKLGLDFRLPTCAGFYNIFHPFDPVAYRIEALVNPDMTGIRPVLIPHHKGRKRMHLELKETMTRVGADLKQRFIDTFKNTLESVNFLTSSASKSKKEAEERMESEVNSVLQMQMQMDQQSSYHQNDEPSQASSTHTPLRTRTDSVSTTQSDTEMIEIDFPLGKLNDSKRIDYVLQEAPLEFFNEYIFALSSHVCYWESEDTILFVMKEIYAGLGISPDSQVPQQSMTIERPNSRNSVSQTLLPL